MGEVIFNGKKYFEPGNDTQSALHHAGIESFRYFHEDDLLICSDSFVKTYNCEKFITNIPDGLIDALIDPRDAADLIEIHRAIAMGENRSSGIIRTKQGHTSRVTLTVVRRNEKGIATECVGIVEDQEEEIRYSGLVQALSEDYQSVYYVNIDKDEIYPYRLSDVIEKQYGAFFYSKPSYDMAVTAYIMNTVVPDERQEMLSCCSLRFLSEYLKTHTVYTHDYRAEHNEKISYYRMKAVNISKSEGLHEMVMGFANISDEKRLEIERYAYRDGLTGGENYNSFKETVRDNGEQGYIVSMDLYAFKTVNVACGTARGDDAIRGVYGCICKNLRQGDLVGHINADHFAIFLKTDDMEVVQEQLNRIAEDVFLLCAQMAIPRLVPYYGASLWTTKKDVEMTYGEANASKHEAKHRKDVNLAFYTIQSEERMMFQKALEDSFDQAILDREFEVWLQGKYSPDDNTLRGAEALSRWRRKDGQLISPGIFIPLFEKNGMIRTLDEYVFRTVCQMQKSRIDAGLKMVPISVNLSRTSMYYRDIVPAYRKIADECGVDPKWVPIEITESAAIDNHDIEALCSDFARAGFPLHLDDFGSGYSSMSTLNVLQFDALKLDKTLIDYIQGSDANGNKLVRHMIALGRDLGMEVVAEGVESEDQKEFLRSEHCDMIQGFYYAKPMTSEEFVKANDN